MKIKKFNAGRLRRKVSAKGRLFWLHPMPSMPSMSAAYEYFDGEKWIDIDAAHDYFHDEKWVLFKHLEPRKLVNKEELLQVGFHQNSIDSINDSSEATIREGYALRR